MKKVLIIDDSALMRRVISDIINADDKLIVEQTASNGQEALNLLRQGMRVDIILVDINMPKMDGVQFLKELNKHRIQTPVLVVSSIASQSANETIEALALGAFDFVKKPNGSIGGGYSDFRKKILLRVYMACGLPTPVREENSAKAVPNRNAEEATLRKELAGRKKSLVTASGENCLVVIASSTGGPRALQSVIPYFPADFPYPVVVIQHMPAGFTQSLAKRLDDLSPLTVKEAEDGEVLKKGVVYIAQGGRQCELVEQPTGTFHLSEKDKPARGGLRPCADVFFESLLDCSLNRFVCGVLTGMGSDGCKGIQQLRECKNVKVVAQNEDTCVVYGMPRAVAQAGVVNEVVPLEDMAGAMIKQTGV